MVFIYNVKYLHVADNLSRNFQHTAPSSDVSSLFHSKHFKVTRATGKTFNNIVVGCILTRSNFHLK